MVVSVFTAQCEVKWEQNNYFAKLCLFLVGEKEEETFNPESFCI